MISVKFSSVTSDGLLQETLPSESHGEGLISTCGRLKVLDTEDILWIDTREVPRYVLVSEGSAEHLRVSLENFGRWDECLEKETSFESRARSMRTFFISNGE